MNIKKNIFKLGALTAVISLGVGLFFSAKFLNTPIIVVYRFGVFGYAYLIGYFVFSHENNIKHLERERFELI